MNKKLIILIILVLLIVTGGVFWWWQGKEETGEKASGGEKTLEERIKEENPEVAKRLEGDGRGEENEKRATSLAELNSFKVPEKCLNGGVTFCDDGICKTGDGTVCTKIVKLQGTANKKTDTFILEDDKEEISFDFFIILSKLPSAEKNPAYKISVYKVGEEKAIWTDSNITTPKELKKVGWTPEHTEYGIKGVAGGIIGADPAIPTPTMTGNFGESPVSDRPSGIGPGEFYFKIEVENVDSWVLRVLKGPIFRG